MPSFTQLVASFTLNEKRLLEVAVRFIEAAPAPVRYSEVAELVRLAEAVPDFAEDGEGVVEVLIGAVRVALIGVNEAEVAERGGLAEAVPDLAVDGEGIVMVLLGAVEVALAGVDEGQVAELDGFARPVPKLPLNVECRFEMLGRITELAPPAENVAEISLDPRLCVPVTHSASERKGVTQVLLSKLEFAVLTVNTAKAA